MTYCLLRLLQVNTGTSCIKSVTRCAVGMALLEDTLGIGTGDCQSKHTVKILDRCAGCELKKLLACL